MIMVSSMLCCLNLYLILPPFLLKLILTLLCKSSFKCSTAKQVSKEERQREMDDTFLGRVISCNCQDLGCGMSNVL